MVKVLQACASLELEFAILYRLPLTVLYNPPADKGSIIVCSKRGSNADASLAFVSLGTHSSDWVRLTRLTSHVVAIRRLVSLIEIDASLERRIVTNC